MQTKRTAESKRPVPMVSGQPLTGESTLLAAWRAHLQALGKPWLTHSHDLWQRFTRTYDHLRQQPRPVRRRVQRQWKASLAGAALALALLNAPAHAAAYTANDAASLIAAINNANADPAPDTITLTGDVTLTAADNGDTGPNGLPVITSVITLEGAGHTLARDATAPAFRLLAVKSTGDLTLNTLTLSNGYNSSSGSGSGSINGGGIFNQGRLTINNSTVSGNRVRVSGGGLYNKGTLTLNNSTVSGNTALARGGGLYNTGTLTLNNSTVSGNTAGNGGGLYNKGTLTLNNSTVSGNTASFSVATGGNGGGILNSGGARLILNNSTVSGNTATSRPTTGIGGGGLFNQGTLTLNRSLIAGNSTTKQGAEIFNQGTVNAASFNLIGFGGAARSVGVTPAGSDLVPSQPLAQILDPLADNGGGTLTHALVTGSPAIDAAGDSGLATDQRGITRPQGAAADIGAFELEQAAASPVNARLNGSDCTLIDAISAANTDTATGSCHAGTAGVDTITLLDDVTLTVANNSGSFGSNGLPVISTAIVIEGANHTINRAADAPTFRLFEVVATGDLTLNQTTLTGGNAASEGSGNQRGFGGAIANAGQLTVSNSTLSGNQSTFSGGAIYNSSALTVTHSLLSDNTSSNNGGGAMINNGVATVTNSTLSGNTSLEGGGAIYNYGTLTVASSTINNNTASYAGGIYNSGVLTVDNSTLSGNTTTGNGGALYNAGWNNGVSTVNHSTLTGNTAAAGGALYNASGGTIHLNTSIASGNTASTGAEINNDGTFTSNTNLLGDSSKAKAKAIVGFTPGASDIVATSDGARPMALAAILNPTLADNGGGTATHALVPGSPAIDAAGVSGLATDQRGISRPQGCADDIGAFEVAGVICPEIDVRGKGVSIPSGSATASSANDTDFGRASVGSPVVRTFTVHNSGAGALTLSGSPLVAVSGANASDFTVTLQPASSVAASDNTTFQIAFAPGASGVRTASVVIANNDSNEGAYTFTLQGTGVQALQPTTQLTQQAGYTQSCTPHIPAATPYVRTCTLAFTLKNTSGGALVITSYQVTTLSSHVDLLNGAPNPGQVGAVLPGVGGVANNGTFQPTFSLGLKSNTAYTVRFKVYGYAGSVVAAGADAAAAIELGAFEATVTPEAATRGASQLFLPVIQQ